MAQPALALPVAAGRPQTGAADASIQHSIQQAEYYCPVCMHASGTPLETFYSYSLHECEGCRLQFWEPRQMPDARWYSAMYGQRNSHVLPLEPGHQFFLSDPYAPRCGRLLDVGCGTGNFLHAASDAGYAVSGIELDPEAARFAGRYCPRSRIFPLPLESFSATHPNEIFDIVTFFEVLEHQADPAAFLQMIRSCLRPRGFIALSVPNRERWQTATDALDFPPNHFLRWNPAALQAALRAHGFSVVSMRTEKPGIRYVAAQVNSLIRTGVSRKIAPELPNWFRDEIQEDPEEKARRNGAKASLRARGVQILGRMKHAACFPVALAAMPYVKWRKLVGSYLYCLARRLD
jgi:2-polyprenyl-3-methyl-5-hydroxy-6-metoxy-1,4-benzoquinol methylase